MLSHPSVSAVPVKGGHVKPKRKRNRSKSQRRRKYQRLHGGAERKLEVVDKDGISEQQSCSDAQAEDMAPIKQRSLPSPQFGGDRSHRRHKTTTRKSNVTLKQAKVRASRALALKVRANVPLHRP